MNITKKLITPFALITLVLSILGNLGSQSTPKLNTPIPTFTRVIQKNTQKVIPTITMTKLPSLTPTTSYFGVAEVSVNVCNLRSGPGKNFSIVGSITKGASHKVYGTDSNRSWLLLDKNKSIWVALSVVTLSKSISSIPIINNLASLEGYKVPMPTISSAGIIPASTSRVIVPTDEPEQVDPTEEPVLEEPTPTDEPVVSNCHPSYPTVCIPFPPPDLDCADIRHRFFRVLPPDPHNFDGDHDGWGCER